MAFVAAAVSSSLFRRPISLPQPLKISQTVPRASAVNIASGGGGIGFLASCSSDLGGEADASMRSVGSGEPRKPEGGARVDWEDPILEATVPLVCLVRMVLHSGTYKSGDRLDPQHEKVILEELLPYHPAYEEKIGCGINHITVGYHPDFEKTRCLFIVRKDGELIDFSYWKCIKALIRKNFSRHAEKFIVKHFGRHKWRRS